MNQILYEVGGWPWCQSNANPSPNFARQQVLGSDQLAPLEQSRVS